jgi:hypothetical protein
VAVLVKVMLAPEITAPLLSRTTPLIEPDSNLRKHRAGDAQPQGKDRRCKENYSCG